MQVAGKKGKSNINTINIDDTALWMASKYPSLPCVDHVVFSIQTWSTESTPQNNKDPNTRKSGLSTTKYYRITSRLGVCLN